MPRKPRQAAAHAEATEQQQAAAGQPTDGTDFNPAELEQQAAGPAEGQPEEAGEGQSVTKFIDPRGRHTIAIGNGRHMRLFRHNRFNQMAIQFQAPEGESPKPAAEDTQWMKDRGWRWRGDDKVWTKQLDRNTDDNRFAKANSDQEAHGQFVELANRIRHRNGLEPIEYSFGEDRSAGR